MKKYLILFFVSTSLFVNSQIRAITEDGKEVILFDNKSWKFINDSDEKTLQTITTNKQIFEKSTESTFLIKSKNIDAGFYYNPKKWKIIKNPTNSTFIEYVFSNTNNPNLFALWGSEKAPIQTLKNLKDIVITTIQKNADYFRLNTSEYRTVNGLKVLYLQYSANTKGLDFEYVANLYLTNDGYCSISSYTYANQYEENKSDLEAFINGIGKIDKTKGIIEVAPPPMPSK